MNIGSQSQGLESSWACKTGGLWIGACHSEEFAVLSGSNFEGVVLTCLFHLCVSILCAHNVGEFGCLFDWWLSSCACRHGIVTRKVASQYYLIKYSNEARSHSINSQIQRSGW